MRADTIRTTTALREQPLARGGHASAAAPAGEAAVGATPAVEADTVRAPALRFVAVTDAATAEARADALFAGPLAGDTLERDGMRIDLGSFAWACPAARSPEASFREAMAREVFGEASVPVEAPFHPSPQREPLTDNAVFQGFVLLLAAAYAVLLYRHPGQIGSLLHLIARERASERLEDASGGGQGRFLYTVLSIGLLFAGVAAVRLADEWLPAAVAADLSTIAWAISPAAAAVLAVVVIYQSVLLRSVGAVTLARPFTLQLLRIKRVYFALAVILTAPSLLLFALCPAGTGRGWLWAAAAISALPAILYVRESLHLFISKKISILHWFLYLCTVEIFPLSLLWLVGVK